MTSPDVCGPVSPHIRVLSLRLRDRGMGWRSGHPTLRSAIQWERWFGSQRYILRGCSKRGLAGRQAITATQPAIYQRNWGCGMGQHCSLWIELKWALSRSDNPLRGQGVLVSTHTHINTLNHVHMCSPPYELNNGCEHSMTLHRKSEGELLSLNTTGWNKDSLKTGKKVRDARIHPQVYTHDTSAQTHKGKWCKDKHCL